MSLVDIPLALDFLAANAMRLIPVTFGPSRRAVGQLDERDSLQLRQRPLPYTLFSLDNSRMPRPSAIVSRFPDRRMIRKRIAPHYCERCLIRTCLHSDTSVALRQPQDVLGEVVQHHLLRDGRDLVEPDLAPEPLDVELLRVAVATVGLQRGVAGLEAGLGAQQLGDAGLGASLLAVAEVPCGFQA